MSASENSNALLWRELWEAEAHEAHTSRELQRARSEHDRRVFEHDVAAARVRSARGALQAARATTEGT